MKKSTKILTAGLAGFLISATSLSVFSGQSEGENAAELINQASLSAEQAIAIALADVPGQVIETELEKEDGILVWEVEVQQSNGQIMEFEIDANNGQIIEKEQDDG